ncbi:hypothetical protein [Phytohabitans aurantiacus]|nr:hypothetical protein [Phytohabitans aurantiacus]
MVGRRALLKAVAAGTPLVLAVAMAVTVPHSAGASTADVGTLAASAG